MTQKHELFEELEAFDPKWQEKHKSLFEAAQAAGANDLLREYLETPQGESYLAHIAAVRDYLTEIQEYQKELEASESKLRYGYHNLSEVSGKYFT